MSKMVVVEKYNKSSVGIPIKEKVHIIEESMLNVKTTDNIKYMKKCMEIERLIEGNSNICYSLDLVDGDELDLENFNRELKDQKTIPSSFNFKIFIIKWVKELTRATPTNYLNIRDYHDVDRVLNDLKIKYTSKNNKR